MTTVEATVATIEAEGLDRFRYVIGDDHANGMDALVLTERDGVWTSFFTSERAAVMTTSIRTYENLSDVLDDLLRLMRQRADSASMLAQSVRFATCLTPSITPIPLSLWRVSLRGTTKLSTGRTWPRSNAQLMTNPSFEILLLRAHTAWAKAVCLDNWRPAIRPG
jgi:hypothetical protein